MASDSENDVGRVRFAVISGESLAVSERGTTRYLVTVVDEGLPPHPSGQLGLPGVIWSRAGIFSVSFNHLSKIGLAAVVKACHPRHVIDIRVAPIYRPLAASMSEFVSSLTNAGIHYWHFPAIANRFSGDAWHPQLFRQRFVRQLHDNTDVLVKIAEWAQSSAVIFISADPATRGSDREILADEIQRTLEARIDFCEIS
jgi:hypothetical protein